MDNRKLLSDIHYILQAAECLVRENKDAELMHAASHYLEKVIGIPDYTVHMNEYFKTAGRDATLRALISKASELSRP
jgi:hypothetical protein